VPKTAKRPVSEAICVAFIQPEEICCPAPPRPNAVLMDGFNDAVAQVNIGFWTNLLKVHEARSAAHQYAQGLSARRPVAALFAQLAQKLVEVCWLQAH